MNEELKKQQEGQELDLFKKFYDFMFDCKQQNVNNNNKKQFTFEEKNKFDYDRKKGNLVPTDNIDNIDLTKNSAFCCIGGFAIMLSQAKDGKTNIYAVNSVLFDNPKAAKIKDRVFKIKDVQVDKAKKFLSCFAVEPNIDFTKQVNNELDFKCVFSEITENNNKQDIERIVEQNQERINVMREFKKQFNEKPELQKNKSFSDFEITGFKDNEKDNKKINLRYNSKGETYMLDENYDKKKFDLGKEDCYFGQYGLLMACTKSGNDKVNIYATNADMKENPFGGNNDDIFAVYNASQEDAERFVDNLNKTSMNEANYESVNSQENFEKFFQGHCRDIKMEKDEGKGSGCCFGLFNCCGGASKAK